jgi:hypothetical protein
MCRVCTDKFSVFLLFCEKGGRQAALFFFRSAACRFLHFIFPLAIYNIGWPGGEPLCLPEVRKVFVKKDGFRINSSFPLPVP